MKNVIDPSKTSRRDFIKLVGTGLVLQRSASACLPEAVASAATTSAVEVGRGLPYRVGKWLPSDQVVLDRWVARLIKEVDANPRPLSPVIKEFKDLINGDAEIYMFFHQMFGQLPRTPQFEETPVGLPQVRDYKHMLNLINAIMTTAPAFDKTGLVGFPINAILNWPMGTPGGFPLCQRS